MNPVRPVADAGEFQLRLHYVRQSPGKGRGVFALTNIQKNSLILESHAVVLSADDCKKIDETSIWIYRFALDGECAIVFGDISFCNHSDTPNAKVVWNRVNSTAAIASLAAVTDIAANAEIVIDYTDIEDYVRRGVVFS
jgi:uncharacterized protein